MMTRVFAAFLSLFDSIDSRVDIMALTLTLEEDSPLLVWETTETTAWPEPVVVTMDSWDEHCLFLEGDNKVTAFESGLLFRSSCLISSPSSSFSSSEPWLSWLSLLSLTLVLWATWDWATLSWKVPNETQSVVLLNKVTLSLSLFEAWRGGEEWGRGGEEWSRGGFGEETDALVNRDPGLYRIRFRATCVIKHYYCSNHRQEHNVVFRFLFYFLRY